MEGNIKKKETVMKNCKEPQDISKFCNEFDESESASKKE